MIRLTELPIEMIHSILEYMDVVEISTCRLVSKWFNETVKAFRVFELSFYGEDWYRKTSWYGGEKLILPLNSLSLSAVPVLSSPSVDLRFLKRLYFAKVKEGDQFSLEVVNSFVWLEKLELEFKDSDWSKGNIVKTLRLNQLKHLYLSFKFQFFIEFYTPKLSYLALSYRRDNYKSVGRLLKTIHFATPTTVRRLDIFGDLNTSGEFLSSFQCVEHFQCDLTADMNLEIILKKFTNLKVLEVWLDESEEFYDEAFDILFQIMQQKERLKPSLQIYFCDVELSSKKEVRSYGFDRESKLASLVQNYSSLVYSHSLCKVDYDELLRLTNGDYQTLKLFHATVFVKVGEKIEDPNRILNFLLNCPNLKSLTLENSSLDTEFYRKLPAYTSLLELIIEEGQDLELDFKFLLKIKNITNFATNQNLGLDVIRGIAQQLKFVEYFDFKIRNQQFSIKKNNGHFQLSRKTSRHAFELIEYCHNIPKLEDLLEYFEKFADDRNGLQSLKFKV